MSGGDLTAVSEVVRRVVGARVRDVHLAEDLTQETLLRVAAATPRLPEGAIEAYAVVTARNVVSSHARRQAVGHRHAHRLVDYMALEGPEAATLQREETDALAVALDRLDPDDRALLVDHEAEGVSTNELADQRRTSPGAIAMRLARARAVLRLEFLLAFRRVTLPTKRCRAVLLAVSAADHRRQDALGAAGHLRSCPVCAQLAPPVAQRRRGVAAWLILPALEAVRRLVASLRQNRLTQLAAAGVVVAAGLTALVAARADPADTTATSSSVAITAATTTMPATAACRAPAVALGEGGVAPAVGCPIAATTLTATDVAADEGFVAETANGSSVWVQLLGEGESPVAITSGLRIVVTGTLVDPAEIDGLAVPVAELDHALRVRFDEITVG